MFNLLMLRVIVDWLSQPGVAWTDLRPASTPDAHSSHERRGTRRPLVVGLLWGQNRDGHASEDLDDNHPMAPIPWREIAGRGRQLKQWSL